MSFFLSEDVQDGDFKEILAVHFSAFEDPPSTLRPVFYPIFGDDPEARARAIEDAARRTVAENKNGPERRWAKVVDTATGRIVAASAWRFHPNDPFTGQPPIVADWWPEGVGRRFSSEWINSLYHPYRRHMRKAHAYLNSLVVHPDFRKRGIATELVLWGLRLVDAKEMVAYVSSSVMANTLYKRLGFTALDPAEVVVKGNADDRASPEWPQLEAECLPHLFYPMERLSAVTQSTADELV